MTDYDDWFTRERLHAASGHGDIEAMKQLIADGYDVNAFDDLGWTPLHHAAQNEHLVAMQLLIDAGANVNAHDEATIGNTPLGHVAGSCSLAAARILVEAGADPSIPGWMQLTALHRAADRKDADGPAVYSLLLTAAEQQSR